MATAPPPEWDLLLTAAQKNRPDLISELIETGGVNPSHANAVGQSALHIAALWGHHESVQALVEKGANVNAQNDMTGATPLHMVAQSHKATLERRIQTVEILVAHGARVDQADHYETLPVQTLYQMLGDEGAPDELTQTLIAKLQPSRPALHEALVERNVSKLQELLEQDASLSNQAYQGKTPVEVTVDDLIQAVQNEEEKGGDNDNGEKKNKEVLVTMLQILLQHGGDANGASESGSAARVLAAGGDVVEPPLHKVVCALRDCYNQHPPSSSLSDPDDPDSSSAATFLEQVVGLLTAAGSRVTPETAQLLHQAARRGEVALARFLVESSLHLDVNLPGRHGMTPLQFAARSGQVEMVVRTVLCVAAFGF